MRKIFLTFGDGSEGLRQAAQRLAMQARATGWFDEIHVYDLSSIATLDGTWWRSNESFVRRNPRGLGYWIWKPKIIYEALRTLSSGDVVVYADAGYEININGTPRFQAYLETARVKGFLGFLLSQTIGQYTKGDTLGRFGVGVSSSLCGYQQHHAGLIIAARSELTVEVSRYWAEVCCEEGGLYLDDRLSVRPSCSNFIDHRHDQSILSLIFWLLNVAVSLPIEDYWPEFWAAGAYPTNYPFHAMRNKTGVARIK
jgi:hypothetical protein